MYLRRVPRTKLSPDLERCLRCFEESGFAVDPRVYFSESSGENSSCPVYARLQLSGRDLFLRLEEADDESGAVCADVVYLGVNGIGDRPAHLVLREAIYEDRFDS